MARKKEADTLSEMRNLIKEKSLIIGTQRTLKFLKQGRLEKVFLSSNCPEKVKADIGHYSSLAGVKVENLPVPNDELGTVCQKQYSISVLGLLIKK